MVRVTETHLIVGHGLEIPLGEIQLRASRSSGPGGQNANKTESRIEAVFNVLSSSSLNDAQRARVTARIGPVVNAISQDARSQLRNREIAVGRLGEKLESALRPRRSRVATRPSRAAEVRRQSAKRARSQRKATRRKPDDSD